MSERPAQAAGVSDPSEGRRPQTGPAVGIGLGLGVLCALASALPAAIRSSGLGAFVVIWASAALLVGPVALGVRLSGVQTRSLHCVGLGVILGTPLLMVFARVLKTTTHHRPLGAVTFAFIGCIVLLGAIAIASRWLALAQQNGSARIRTAARITLGVASVGSLLAILVGALRAALADASVRSLLLDAALLAVAAGLGARVPVPSSLGRVLERAGALIFFVLIVLGVAIGRSSAVAESVAAKAPLFGWLAGF